ncbi:hypothetical protein [Mesorhizobium tianshanense]|nr:hypothetical protein [Mesorhizobium tianshanense]
MAEKIIDLEAHRAPQAQASTPHGSDTTFRIAPRRRIPKPI